MDIKIDSDTMAQIASKAIFDELSADQRDKVLMQAIQSLLIPDNNQYSPHRGKTAMQVAFDQAIHVAANKAVMERIANDPAIAAKIDELLGPILLKGLEASAENYDYGLSEAIGSAVGNWLAQKARGE